MIGPMRDERSEPLRGERLDFYARELGLVRKRFRFVIIPWVVAVEFKERDERFRARILTFVMSDPEPAVGYAPERAGFVHRWGPWFGTYVFAAVVCSAAKYVTGSWVALVIVGMIIGATMPPEWSPSNRKWIG